MSVIFSVIRMLIKQIRHKPDYSTQFPTFQVSTFNRILYDFRNYKDEREDNKWSTHLILFTFKN
jgi:hypothetical protein